MDRKDYQLEFEPRGPMNRKVLICTNTSVSFLPLCVSLVKRLRAIEPTATVCVFSWDHFSEAALRVGFPGLTIIPAGFEAAPTIPLTAAWRRVVGRKIDAFLWMAKQECDAAIWLDANVFVRSGFADAMVACLENKDFLASREPGPQAEGTATNYNTGQIIVRPSARVVGYFEQVASIFENDPERHRLAEQTIINLTIAGSTLAHDYLPLWASTTNSTANEYDIGLAKTVHQVGGGPGICLELFLRRGWL